MKKSVRRFTPPVARMIAEIIGGAWRFASSSANRRNMMWALHSMMNQDEEGAGWMIRHWN